MSALEQTRETLVSILVELQTLPGNCELNGMFCDGTEWDHLDQAIVHIQAAYTRVALSLDARCVRPPSAGELGQMREQLLAGWDAPLDTSDLSGPADREAIQSKTKPALTCKCGHELSPEVVTDVHGSYRACMGCGNYIEIEEDQ